MTMLFEDYNPFVKQNGFNTNKNITIGGSANFDMSGSTGTFKSPTGTVTLNNLTLTNGLTGANLVTGKGYYVVAGATTGTTNNSLFSSMIPGFAGSITAVLLISQDTTAASISVVTANGCISAVNKGVTTGNVTAFTASAGAITNNGFNATQCVYLVSNTAGNAIVIATFQVA